MKALAIDQATVSGYAVVDLATGKLVESGVWKLADTKRTGESRGMRYFRFRKRIEETFEKYPDIGLIVHEQTLLRGGAATEIANALKGLILLAAVEHTAEVSCVHPSELKRFATGNGKAEKEDMIKAAECVRNGSVIDDNEADAILIGAWTSFNYGAFPCVTGVCGNHCTLPGMLPSTSVSGRKGRKRGRQ